MIEETFLERSTKVIFREDILRAYESKKEDTPYFLAVEMEVFIDGEFQSRYYRNFERKVHYKYFENFMKKMLTDKEYRKQYHAVGKHWEGTIEYKKEEKKLG